MKKLVIALFAAMCTMAFGATINIGGSPTTRLQVQNSTGTVLTEAASYYVTVGTYATGNIPTGATDLASLNAAITNFVALRDLNNNVVTLANSATNNATIAGQFVGTGPGALSSANIYIFISNTANYLEATQLAILGAGSSASPVKFPDPITGSGSITVTPSFALTSSVLGLRTDNATGFDTVTMVAIPEPSAMLLGVVGLVGLLRRRR